MIEIHWTANNLDEARRICQNLVRDKLVACAQIIPQIESIYLWKGQIEREEECKIVLKTANDYLEPIKEYILKNSSYEVPEIVIHDIEVGNLKYLQWMKESLKIDHL